MNIEKQTYLNTERMQAMFEKAGSAVACYGPNSRFGGVRFCLAASAKVAFEVDFYTIAADASVYVGGYLACKTARPSSRFCLMLSKGEHLLDVDCTSHGGFVLKVSAAGLSEGRLYFDRTGGHSLAGETVVYLTNGERGASSYRRTAGGLEVALLSSPVFDDAYLFDKVNGVYTDDRAYIGTGVSRSHAFLNFRNTVTLPANSRVEHVAICDGMTLGDNADFIAAYVYDGAKLCFARVLGAAADDSDHLLDYDKPVLRVVSAQRGSVLMLQQPGGVWTAFAFNEYGESALHFGQITLHYDEVPLCKNPVVAPSATVDEEGSTIFSPDKEDGRLWRRELNGAPQVVGYQEAYHAGVSGGFMQFCGEVKYQNA